MASHSSAIGPPTPAIMRAALVTLSLLLPSVFSAGCSGSPERSRTSEQRYAVPAELFLTIHADRGTEGEVYILGSTNLPDGMKMWVNVNKSTAIDDNVVVHSGQIRTAGLWSREPNPHYTKKMAKWPDGATLKYRTRPLAAGTHRIHLTAYFNGSWQTQEVLEAIGGEGGRKLSGKVFKLTDPDVADSYKMLDDSALVNFPELSPTAKAITLVKGAILTVPGMGRSATDVEANIKFFMGPDTGILPAKGWSATAKNADLYEVALDYINGRAGEQQAIWSVNLRTEEVRYLNMNAKAFSWTPDY